MKTIHIIVSGRVQGVYFRAYTQKQANKLNINGFVRNRPDGSVEIVAYSSEVALEDFITWCHKGPLLAKVSHVIVNNYPTHESYSQFEIR